MTDYERVGSGYDPGAVGHELQGRARAPVEISTKPCGHCEGSGVQPSDEMVRQAQQALDRGLLDGDDIIALVKRMYAQATSRTQATE